MPSAGTYQWSCALHVQTQLELPPDAVVLIAVLRPGGDGAQAVSQPEPAQSWSASGATASEQNGAGQVTAGFEPSSAPQPGNGAASDLGSGQEAVGGFTDDAEVAAANGVFYPSPIPEDADGDPAEGPRDAATGDLLVGTFEVAFTEAVRTKELTLNPPGVRSWQLPVWAPQHHRPCGLKPVPFTLVLTLT